MLPSLGFPLHDHIGAKNKGPKLACCSIMVLDQDVILLAECFFTLLGCKDPLLMGLIVIRMDWNTVT
jgi:hypothetical protein